MLEIRRVLAAGITLAAEPAVSHNLVFITHGWNSNVDDWVSQIQSNTVRQLNEMSPRDGVAAQPLHWSETQATLVHATPDPDTRVLWEVATFDWRDSAGTFLPTTAANNAASLGARYVTQDVVASQLRCRSCDC